MFYDIFLELCSEKGVTPAQVRKDLSISQSTMASWKSRGLNPNASTMIQLAEYFDTTPAYLLGNRTAKKPVDENVYPLEKTYKEPDEKGKVIIPSVLLGVDGFEGLDDTGRPIVKKGSRAEIMLQEEKEGLSSVKYAKYRIDNAFYRLNDEGKKEAANRIEELVFIPKYRNDGI